MTANLLFGLDVGGGLIKGTLCQADSSMKPVPDAAGNDVFLTAVFKDPKTGEYLYSYDAMSAGTAEPSGLAMDFKRHMGDDTKRYFNATASAKDVAAIFLAHIKERVAAVAGQTVVDCCVTTPFVWNDAAKRNYLQALDLAGLKPIPAGKGGVGILTEPTAAALAYADMKSLGNSGTRVMVVDVGLTTTDVSIVKLDAGAAEVLGGNGDENLGGFNIQRDLHYLVLSLAQKEGILKQGDLSKLQTVAEHRVSLLRAVEDAMKALSHRPDTRIPITFGVKPGVVKITREQYECAILEKHVRQICATIDKAKANAIASGKLTPETKLDYLVPVGGPCRNPFIQARIAKHVGLPAKTDIDPIRAIVNGAAKHAFWLMAQREQKQVFLAGIIRPKECVPHDIAVMTMDGPGAPWRSKVIFQKGQTAPLTTTVNLMLLEDHQTGVICPFVQSDGDRQLKEDCHSLGEVTLSGLPLEAVRTPRIQITASFDEAAMVKMEVVDLISGQRKQVQFAAMKAKVEQNAV